MHVPSSGMLHHMGTYLANVLEHLHKTFHIIIIVWNYHSFWLKQKETISKTLLHCQNEWRPKLTRLFSVPYKYTTEAKQLFLFWWPLKTITCQNSKIMIVLTHYNYENYTIIILTVASFRDFSLICFNLINLCIRDVQHSGNHFPWRTKLVCNKKNIIFWKSSKLERDTFI